MTVSEGRRRALLVGTGEYDDPSFERLRAPTNDVEALAGVLGDPAVGGFELEPPVIDATRSEICEHIEDFFHAARPRDLLLLYLSCHGQVGLDRKLYFVARDTKARLLRATGISEGLVREVMQDSRSKRIVLLLDCCYSGAFAEGLTAKGTAAPDVADRFGGEGRVTLTASAGGQPAFEGRAEGAPPDAAATSLFTRVLVDGLRSGRADLDGDGHVSVDELYDFVVDGLREQKARQTPGWSGSKIGDVWIARSAGADLLLPQGVREQLASADVRTRLLAVHQLVTLLHTAEPAVAQAAKRTLRGLADDDSRKVSHAAQVALAIATDEGGGAPGPARAQKPPRRAAAPRETPPEREPEREPEPEPEPREAEPEALRLGREALEAGRYAAALTHFERASEAMPGEAAPLAGAGWALLRLHRVAAAEERFDRALALDPDDVSALAGRARARAQRSHADEALADADRAVALDRGSAAAHTARGAALDAYGRVEERRRAIGAYDAALRIAPDDVEALAGRSLALSAIGDVPAALADAERALELAPAATPAIVARANVRLLAGALAEAVEELELLVARDRAPDAHAALALAHLREDRTGEAETAARQALDAQPDHALGLAALGLAEYQRDDYAAALATFQRLAATLTTSGFPLVMVAGAQVLLDDAEGAARTLRRAESLDPELEVLLADMELLEAYHLWRGRAFLGVERYADAVKALDAAVGAAPRSAMSRYWRAVAYAETERWEQALSDLTRGLEFAPDDEVIASFRRNVVRHLAATAPERLPARVRRELEEGRERNVALVESAKFENGYYTEQKRLLLEQLNGTEQPLWLCRCARHPDVFRSVALLLTDEKIVWCRESLVSSAEAGWIAWPAVTEVTDVDASSAFKVTGQEGFSASFSQIAGGIDLSGEGLDLSGSQLRDAVRRLVEQAAG
jgi:tetratricopeptide (TPR) repeat protein